MFERKITTDRASVDMDTGEFRAILATSGEAADSHILSIAGAEMPDKVPFFVNHMADPTTQIGSLHYVGRTDHELHVRAQIMLGGEGVQAEIRRDLLHKVSEGHADHLSVRWDQHDWDGKRRTELPPSHPAHVTEARARKSPRLRQGIYFERWRVREGSLVGLAADPAAVARFAADASATEAVRTFWRLALPAPSPLDELLERVAALEGAVVTLAEAEPAPQPARSFNEVLDERAEQLKADFGAYLEWKRGKVLFGSERAAAARIRDRLDALRADARRRG